MTLLENHVTLCKEIQKTPTILDMLYLSKLDREKTLAEVNFICHEEGNANPSHPSFPSNPSELELSSDTP
jgi:hypothetical protein